MGGDDRSGLGFVGALELLMLWPPASPAGAVKRDDHGRQILVLYPPFCLSTAVGRVAMPWPLTRLPR